MQVLGGSRSGRGGLGFGKLWTVADMVGLRLSEEHFDPDDPHFNPDDRGMRQIHCCVWRQRPATQGGSMP